MSKPSQNDIATGRREFLRRSLTAGAGAAAAWATVGTASAAFEPAPLEAAPETRTRKGYRETRHIRDYYRTAAL